MMLTPKDVIEIVSSQSGYRQHNYELIDVFDGNLTKYIIADLKKTLSPQAFEQQMHRLSPINILPKIVDKLTNIYSTSVSRQTEPEGQAMLDWYVKEMNPNLILNSANELYNLTKSSLVYPYVSKGKPKLRVIHNDKFAVYSDNPEEPQTPTHVILLAGKKDGLDIYWTWSGTQFLISDSDGKVCYDMMAAMENPEGINPIGRLPFVYVNASLNQLLPPQDTDTLTMVKLLPILLSDLNLAAMFQCFSIIYGIDVSDENIKFAPNAFWSLKSDKTSDKKPEIGTIKPQVDYDQVLNLIQAQLTMWLSSKGIRAGSIGQLTAENAASGISKLIDEMDTYEARQAQVETFVRAEAELWDLVLKYMHPYWFNRGLIDNPATFPMTAEVVTTFALQLPTQTRGAVVRDLRDERASGFISRRRAVKKLNPEMTEAEIDLLIAEIDAERTIDNGEGDADTVESAEGVDQGAAGGDSGFSN